MPRTRQTGAFPQTTTHDDVINLRLGQPSPALLPLEAIAEAAARQLRGPELVLQYGRREGTEGFRGSLAAFLTQGYRHPVHPDELAVTGGTSSALSFVGQVLARSGDVIVSGDPTYFLAHGIFASQHLETVGVPVDDDGLDVGQLAAKLEEGLRPRFVYCIPSFHNPRGVCLAPERARRLVDLAERHDFVIVADEPYNLLHFSEPPPCMMSFDEGRGRVLSVGSFSKILGPGLRLGWIHAAPALRDRVLEHGSLRSGGCLNPVIAHVVHDTIDSGFLARHVAHLRGVLGGRARVLGAALEAAGLPAPVVPGGYFTWLQLDGVDTDDLLERALADHGVGFCPGARCAVDRDLRSSLRLSFAFYDEAELKEGVERLAKALATA